MITRIAVIGEFYKEFLPHTTLNQSLNDLSHYMNVPIEVDWIETTELVADPTHVLSPYHGIWSAPGSPFKSLEGALNAIKFARENNVPHLGTCAGFQHSIIEIARDMLGFSDAQHEEYSSEPSSHLFINKLACSLSGKTMKVQVMEGTNAYKWYKKTSTEENYYCNFGINPHVLGKLKHKNLIYSGVDQDGEIRIIELKDQDYFVATLFVPQSRSTLSEPHPLIQGFLSAAIRKH